MTRLPFPNRRLRRGTIGVVSSVLLLLVAVPATALPWADDRPPGRQQEDESPPLQRQEAKTGAVAGEVLEFDGTPLPAVTVRLRGPLPDRSERTTVSDKRARFLFTGLPPGRYELAVVLPDIQAGSDREVEVRPGQQVVTTLQLSLFATEIEVVAEAVTERGEDLYDRESTGGRRTVETETLDRLPLPAEQALEVLPLLPGVVRDADGQISVDGTFPAQSILLFNGIDLMDPFSGQFRLRLPLEAVDRVEVYDGVYPAAFGNVVGGIVNVDSAPGGEEWKYDLSSIVPRPRFKDGTIQGLRSASPRIRVSGPVGSGLYLSQASEYHFDRVTVEDVPGDPPRDSFKIEGWETVTQLDWEPNERHSSRFTLLAFPQRDEFVGLDGLTPPEATLDFERDAEAVLGSHRWRIDDVTSLDVSVQYNRIGIRSAPQGPAPLEVIPEGFRGNAFRSEDRQTSHFQLQGSYSHLVRERGDPTSHLLEFGGEIHRLNFDGSFDNDTILVRGVDGRILRRVDFLDQRPLEEEQFEWSLYAQDRWWHSARFWCDFGLRYTEDSLTGDSRFSPRIGAAWDPAGDRRTLLKAAGGVMYRRVYLGETLWEELPSRVVTTFPEGAAEGEPTRARVRSLEPRIDDELSAPWSVLVTVEGSHRISPELLVRARYFRREVRDRIVFDRRDAPGFLPATAIAPAAEALPVTGLDELPTAARGELPLSNAGKSTSWGMELTARYRLPRDSRMYFSYVWSSAEGDLNEFNLLAGEQPDPILRPNRRGRLPFDVPHRFLAWGTLNLPLLDLEVAPVVEWRSGFPFSALTEDQFHLGQPSSERFPPLFGLDVQVARTFSVMGYRVKGGVKVTNLTDHFNARQVIANAASARFGELRNNVGLKIRGKFSLSF